MSPKKIIIKCILIPIQAHTGTAPEDHVYLGHQSTFTGNSDGVKNKIPGKGILLVEALSE